MDIGVLAEYPGGPLASPELVVLHLTGPQPLVTTCSPSYLDRALMVVIVSCGYNDIIAIRALSFSVLLTCKGCPVVQSMT